ncbi:hypothetical protein E2C01_018733 [Portunus trituberculatus]|uniref:Uncharacterized protein n=1 Tax=Portunus trituberculatus TaxID=210409 RepID=A0A5B7DXD6_PORTR|nr:hypothetical protein [Portunus trituberculatus]
MLPRKKSPGSADLEDYGGLEGSGEEQYASTSTREVHAFRDEEKAIASSSRSSHSSLVAAQKVQEPKNTRMNLYQYGNLNYGRRYVQERPRISPERPKISRDKHRVSPDKRHTQNKQHISPNRLTLSPDRPSHLHKHSLADTQKRRRKEKQRGTISSYMDIKTTTWIIVICTIICIVAALYLSFNLGVVMAMKKAGNL